MGESREAVKLEAELVIGEPGSVRVEPTSGDPWIDFGYWLEAAAFMARLAMEDRGWGEAEIVDYVQQYLARAIPDYEVKSRE